MRNPLRRALSATAAAFARRYVALRHVTRRRAGGKQPGSSDELGPPKRPSKPSIPVQRVAEGSGLAGALVAVALLVSGQLPGNSSMEQAARLSALGPARAALPSSEAGDASQAGDALSEGSPHGSTFREDAFGPGAFPGAFEEGQKAPLAGVVRYRGALMRVSSETLWLARCLYSESNRPKEQELVAWVVRNRVETRFRGRSTYRGVVLDPYQFSAFNPGRPFSRHFYSRIPVRAGGLAGWRRTLAIAWHVRHASPADRPFPLDTRHFYSPVSMPGGRPARWAVGRRPVSPERPWPVDPQRFRFYAGVGPRE